MQNTLFDELEVLKKLKFIEFLVKIKKKYLSGCKTTDKVSATWVGLKK